MDYSYYKDKIYTFYIELRIVPGLKLSTIHILATIPFFFGHMRKLRPRWIKQMTHGYTRSVKTRIETQVCLPQNYNEFQNTSVCYLNKIHTYIKMRP